MRLRKIFNAYAKLDINIIKNLVPYLKQRFQLLVHTFRDN